MTDTPLRRIVALALAVAVAASAGAGVASFAAFTDTEQVQAEFGAANAPATAGNDGGTATATAGNDGGTPTATAGNDDGGPSSVERPDDGEDSGGDPLVVVETTRMATTARTVRTVG